MKKIIIMLTTVFFIGTVLSSISFAEEKEATGKKLFEDKCSICHSTKRATNKKKSVEGWTKTVTRMQKKLKGHISDEEASKIIEYLSKEYGLSE